MAARKRPTQQRPDLPPLPDPEAGRTAELGWLTAMEMLTKKGDERAAAAIKASRRTRPEMWDALAGVSHQAENAWLSLMQPDEVQFTATRQLLQHDLDGMRKRLLAGSRDPVDELLVSRVITTWMAATHADMVLTHQRRSGGSVSIKQLEYHDGVADRAHRAHLRAIESLAKVQRLRQPAVQVNVGSLNVTAAPVELDVAAPAVLDERGETGATIEAQWHDQGEGEAVLIRPGRTAA